MRLLGHENLIGINSFKRWPPGSFCEEEKHQKNANRMETVQSLIYSMLVIRRSPFKYFADFPSIGSKSESICS